MFLLPISQYLLAFLLTTLFSGTNAYLTQRIFVWQSSAKVAAEASKFFTVFISQTIANIFLLYVFVDYFNFHPLWTQYVIAAVFIVLTYLSHKHWTFKSK
jgi:putative flippase GtrA